MAGLYESYTINYLAFSFRTSRSTATNGSVMMAVDYDVQDAAPPSKTQLMAYNNAQRTQPWCDMTYVCNLSDVRKIPNRYVRSGLIANADLKLFDVGNLFIATQGCQDTSVLGELYVHYDITFKTTQYDVQAYASQGSNRSTGNTGITGTLLLGTSPTLNISGSGMAINYNTTNGGITFGTTGSFLITYNVTTTAQASGSFIPTMTGGSQVSTVTLAAATTLLTVSFTVNVINTTDVLTVTGLSLTNPSAAVLRVSSYPFNP